MTYRIKATNKWTGQTMILAVPVFTDLARAKKFVKDCKPLLTKAGKMKVVKDKK